MVDTPITEVIYCSPEFSHPELRECSIPIRYLDYIPDVSQFTDRKPRLVIFDDMMREFDVNVVDLFTRLSHHLSISVIFICQNIFHRNKGQRDVSLNSHY